MELNRKKYCRENGVYILPLIIDKKTIKLIGLEKLENICQVAIEIERINIIRDNKIKNDWEFLDKQNGF